MFFCQLHFQINVSFLRNRQGGLQFELRHTKDFKVMEIFCAFITSTFIVPYLHKFSAFGTICAKLAFFRCFSSIIKKNICQNCTFYVMVLFGKAPYLMSNQYFCVQIRCMRITSSPPLLWRNVSFTLKKDISDKEI